MGDWMSNLQHVISTINNGVDGIDYDGDCQYTGGYDFEAYTSKED